ncbi:MAG TPA: RNA methyltransferase [Vicinamibacterales bacterium]|nr:RNA methyltransferase [Vicinamibacterales bacterium]
MAQITSRQHPIVRAFKSAALGEAGVLLDGWHLLHDAADAGIDISIVAITDTPHDAANLALLEALARSAEVVVVSQPVMNALSPVRTPSGVAALARATPCALDDVLTPAPGLVVVGSDVQDPGNAGAIIRSAEAGGATGVVLTGGSADPWGWKALRAAMGSTFRLPVLRHADVLRAGDELRQRGLRVLAAVPQGGIPMHRVDLGPPTALILGGEGGGLTNEVLLLADQHVTIPMQAPVESLNVAVAAAVLVYEARRQRAVSAPAG